MITNSLRPHPNITIYCLTKSLANQTFSAMSAGSRNGFFTTYSFLKPDGAETGPPAMFFRLPDLHPFLADLRVRWLLTHVLVPSNSPVFL